MTGMSVGAGDPLSRLGRYQKTRRYVLGALLVLLVFLTLFFQSSWRPESVMHEIIEMSGVVMIALGIIGRLWANLYIAGRKSQTVVTDGPYSITRNPLYLFSALAAGGVGAQIGSFATTIGFAALCALAFHVVILREERFLTAAFGKPYEDYMRKVPRFFPKPWLYREGETGSFQPKGLLSTLLDGLLFFLAMPLFEFVDAAQLDGTLPVLLRLP